MATNAIRTILAVLVITALGSISKQLHAQTQLPRNTFVGVWRGKMDNLPAAILNITDESGNLTGAALFYLHERKTVTDPYTSTPGIPEPMFNFSASGNVLRFEISHRRAHPPRTLHDPPVHFRLTVTGPDQAELVMEGGKNETAGPPLLMVRGDH
jgi:hypothetical protein